MIDLLNSKKFMAGIIAMVIGGVLLYLELPFDQVMGLMSPLLTYQIGQGIADHGKERERMKVINEMIKQDNSD